jgi:small nuclear ribonucleoprotein (snRNP)-like protein
MAQQQTNPVHVIRKHKASLLSLDQYLHKPILLELSDLANNSNGSTNGRMVRGTLKGFDSNLNVILADALIIHQDALNPFSPQITNSSHKDVCRALGATIIRGSTIQAVYAANGSQLLTAASTDPLAQ